MNLATKWRCFACAALMALACEPKVSPINTRPPQSQVSQAKGNVQLDSPKAHGQAGNMRAAPEVNEGPSLYAMGDDTLLVQTQQALFARASDGRTFRYPLESGDRPNNLSGSAYYALGEGVELHHADSTCTFLKTPSLEVVAKGSCFTPINGRAIVISSDPTAGTSELVLQHGGLIRKFALLREARSPTDVQVGEGARFVFLAWDESGQRQGRIYNAATGAFVASVKLSAETNFGSKDVLVYKDKLYVARDNALFEIALESGKVLRTLVTGCSVPRKVGSGNASSAPSEPNESLSTTLHSPMVAASGALITLGCGGDLLTFKSGRRVGRIPRVAPGCDNGLELFGHLNSDGNLLTLEGCGGIARIDLQRQVYLCADNEGIAGARYSIAGEPTGGAPLTRAKLPKCSPTSMEGAVVVDERTRAYWFNFAPEENAQGVLLQRAGTVPLKLEAGATSLVVYARETLAREPLPRMLAYMLGKEVILRELPSGEQKGRWLPK
jgi:hypothetical protein